jgi:hypothetical protein
VALAGSGLDESKLKDFGQNFVCNQLERTSVHSLDNALTLAGAHTFSTNAR